MPSELYLTASPRNPNSHPTSDPSQDDSNAQKLVHNGGLADRPSYATSRWRLRRIFASAKAERVHAQKSRRILDATGAVAKASGSPRRNDDPCANRQIPQSLRDRVGKVFRAHTMGKPGRITANELNPQHESTSPIRREQESHSAQGLFVQLRPVMCEVIMALSSAFGQAHPRQVLRLAGIRMGKGLTGTARWRALQRMAEVCGERATPSPPFGWDETAC